jgi:hypothetical protein
MVTSALALFGSYQIAVEVASYVRPREQNAFAFFRGFPPTSASNSPVYVLSKISAFDGKTDHVAYFVDFADNDGACNDFIAKTIHDQIGWSCETVK